MSEAAKKMHIAQPSVSGTIGEIEEQYGVRLFERLGRRLYITATGTQLREYARHILSMYDAMEQRLKNADESDMLRVGHSGNLYSRGDAQTIYVGNRQPASQGCGGQYTGD